MAEDHNGETFSADDRQRLWQMSEAFNGMRRELGQSRRETESLRSEVQQRFNRWEDRIDERFGGLDTRLDEMKKEFVQKGDYTLMRNIFIAIVVAMITAFIAAIQVRTP